MVYDTTLNRHYKQHHCLDPTSEVMKVFMYLCEKKFIFVPLRIFGCSPEFRDPNIPKDVSKNFKF